MQKYSDIQYGYLRESGKILHAVFDVLKSHVCAGVSTLELDKIAEDFIRSKNAEPAFKHYQGFKFSICASVNEESIHGLPRKNKILREGDIVSLDIGVRFPQNNPESMCTDAARTFAVGDVSAKARNLINDCQLCFDTAVEGLKAGDLVKDIGKKIERFVDKRYGIIDVYFGHGIGHTIHEGALIPNFDVDKVKTSASVAKMAETVLEEGMIICIEPMINCGTKHIRTTKDGWTVVTADGSLAAHYENTVLIGRDGVEIIT